MPRGSNNTSVKGSVIFKRDPLSTEVNVRRSKIVQEKDSGLIVNGKRIWRNAKGELHRIGGPALIDNGREEWWINGVRHRADGPAATTDWGNEWYYYEGKLHREDGPAVVARRSVDNRYYLFDEQLPKREWKKRVKKLKASA